MSIPFREEDIPILTEVIEEAGLGPEQAPPTTSSSPRVHATPIASRSEEVELPRWSAADKEALERKLEDRILRQLHAKIDTVIEQQVRDVLADVLQTAITDLANDIRVQLQSSMERAVANAVAQEVARLPKTED